MDTQERIDELLGTCNSINMEDWTLEELEMLDDQIFECGQCGWWCEIGDNEDSTIGMICRDCHTENEEE